MIRKFLVFGFFAAWSVFGFGQGNRRVGKGNRIARSDIQLLYNHYIQNGDHSAVTGGQGTEKLTVYAPELIISHQVDSLNSYRIDAGIDVISSASTDNIDFAMSSASKVDQHAYLNLGYERYTRPSQLNRFSAMLYSSMESDFLSFGGKLGWNGESKSKMRSYSASLEYFRDDLRWGRLSGEYPLKLVYPAELRGQEWFDHYLRHSINLDFSFSQTLNERMVIGLFPGLAWQSGLLSTPFHRVYFTDGGERVEMLPSTRFKIPIGIQFNAFIGKRYILRPYYRFYHDDFGITAHTISTELVVKFNNNMQLAPYARWYRQNAAGFFQPFGRHDPQAAIYSSDYDYSAFHSIEMGMEWSHGGFRNGQHSYLNRMSLRYGFYDRSDGLKAHMLSLLFNWIHYKNRQSPEIVN